ncbi:hypothetical protein C7S18_15845 [Ahniella affigens]|uniref:DUF2092 domain-containing protein n=1 Tax=Ahniella affigens TaxID=2021234 RepID=A0A2P1PUQ7_9GAMM|nr:hypothetical protein [Ahniella affigens]AVP98568.1 hypothetical protein C7S18_15845 [Ahniella affigens]
MNQTFHNELSSALAQHVAATTVVPEAAINAAQHRLNASLQNVRPAPDLPPRRRLAFAAVATLAVAAMLVLPLLPDSGRAFAAARAHFMDFKTLAMRVEQHHNGALLQSTEMLVSADGSVRTDVGEQMSVIVDQTRHQLMVLLHEPREASIMSLPNVEPRPDASLDWLKEIRAFQGEATRLEQTRIIDGRETHGWALDVGATQLQLWVDADGLPIAMEQTGEANLQIRYRFQFNVTVPPGHLSSILPPGYRLVQNDQD